MSETVFNDLRQRIECEISDQDIFDCTKAGNGLVLGQGWDTGHEQWITR